MKPHTDFGAVTEAELGLAGQSRGSDGAEGAKANVLRSTRYKVEVFYMERTIKLRSYSAPAQNMLYLPSFLFLTQLSPSNTGAMYGGVYGGVYLTRVSTRAVYKGIYVVQHTLC